MAMHGSNGVGCATTLAAAARLAAATSASHVPPLVPRTGDQLTRQPGGAGRPGAVPHADRDSCATPIPGAVARDRGRTAVVGGGACAPRPAVVPDPALAALAGMLGSATPPPRGESVLQQLTSQLSTMLASISSRLAALRPEAADAATMMLPAASDAAPELPRVDPSLLLRQPPPPPIGPILSLDPATGMIVDPLDGAGADSGDGQGGEGGTGSLDDPQFGLPSSWVPVPSGLLARARRRLGSITDRIDALLDEVGMTRLQLLLLTLLGPAAVAFAIDVVVTLLAER